MKLKFIVTNESDLPTEPALKALYTEVNGKWVMDIEGAVPKERLDEFRENNTTLQKKLDAFGEITPEAIEDLRKKAAEGGTKKTAEEIEAEVERRVGDMKKAHETALEAERTKAAKLQEDLTTHVIDRSLIDAGTELGLRSSATEDLTYRGRKKFRLDEHGKPVAIDDKGNILYNAAGEPLTPKDFVTDLTKSAAHLFEPSGGSGAGGSGAGGSGAGGGNQNPGAKNPWKQDSYNVTEQSKIYRENPTQAKQLAAAAGVTL